MGMAGYGVAGGIAFFTPVVVPLVAFMVLPAFYYLTSYGMKRARSR